MNFTGCVDARYWRNCVVIDLDDARLIAGQLPMVRVHCETNNFYELLRHRREIDIETPSTKEQNLA